MKRKKFTTILLVLLLLATLNICFANNILTCLGNVTVATEITTFQPSILNTTAFDENQNKIADSLENLVLIDSLTSTGDKTSVESYDSPPVYVTVMLEDKPTSTDMDAFLLNGGVFTTDLWDSCIYGFGGLIPLNKIISFSTSCPNLLLIEQEATSHSFLAYATTQVGARDYVWSTLGYLGDLTSAIAVVDTGIDGSHVDFSVGYGDKDFTKKIVGWNDQVGTSTNPYDDNGHGSHCSGIASGDGFYSVDNQGNAQSTWSGNLGTVSTSGTYYISGSMVNKTGVISLTVEWSNTGTAKLSAISLYYGGKTLNPSSWTSVSTVNTPSKNTLYTLTYNVASTPTSGYDLYHVLMTLTRGTGSLYVAYSSSWPYSPPTDSYPVWSGIAPQSKLVGVKVLDNTGSGTSNQMLNGINWIINNRVGYHITVASLSLGFASEVAAVDSAIVNLVNSGITTVVAAGNSGAGTNYIYSPGSVDEALTVSAINQFDGISSYSSQGGTSRYSGKTIKPDIAAPGGSFFAAPILSVDTNANDAEGKWVDLQSNDAAPMQGTSMATPLVAGAANILVQAMGGYNDWLWTRNQALQPKMLLLMTSTETYPNSRELSSYSPTLDRGGKDAQEGYGRMNLDAAVDALTKSYVIGSTETSTLSNPPTLTDISELGQPLAFARNVQLVSGYSYSFMLNVPQSADYDLYLYNNTGTTYGEPAIVAKSTSANTGGTESLQINAPYTGTYYVVVKRATEATSAGTFTLSSTGPVSITVNTPGLANAVGVIHYTLNGVPKIGSVTLYTFSVYADSGTNLQIDASIYSSTVSRCVTVDPTSFLIQTLSVIQVNYFEQVWVQINSTHGTPQSPRWTNVGDQLTLSVQSPTDSDGNGLRYVCTGWQGTGDFPLIGTSNIVSLTITQPSNITWIWKTQYLLSATSNLADPNLIPSLDPVGEYSPPNSYWYDSMQTVLLTSTTQTGYAFTNWNIDNIAQNQGVTQISLTMNTPHNAIANYLYKQSLLLNPGWNMVSFTVIPSDTTVESIFSGISFYQILTWDGTKYTTPTTIQAGQGYWILVLTQTTLDQKGTQPSTHYSADLAAGWNMIGSIYQKTVNAAEVFPNFYQLETWTGTNYATASTIESGKGYWALVLSPTQINVS